MGQIRSKRMSIGSHFPNFFLNFLWQGLSAETPKSFND